MQEVKQPENKSANNVNEFNRYLNNNVDILKEKFKEYYGESFPLEQLNTQQEGEATLKYIYDIFNFSKYESNPKLNTTLRNSLLENTRSFVQKMKGTTQTFDPDLAITLLKYCIEHNDMFAVSYDKKKTQKKHETEEHHEEVQPEEESQEEVKPQVTQQPQQVASEPQTPQKSQNGQSKANEKELNQMGMNLSNQFGAPSEHHKVENIDLIKKQLKGVFQFYCKQQQNVGPNFTFDNINHKCQTMNLGKFIAFAVAANLVHSRDKAYSEGKLQKNQLVSVFKKIASGQREIGFPAFLKIMQELKKNDEGIFERLGLGEEGSKGMTKLNEKLKYFNLPFGTRDSAGREVSRYNKVFVPKLTSHSGKSEDALRDELVSRKQRGNEQIVERPRAISKLDVSRHMQNTNMKRANEPETKMTLKLGQSNEMEQNDLNFLSKLITHQQNDEVFLKEYKLPHSKTNHHRERALSNSHQQTRFQEDTHLNLNSPKLLGQNMGGLTTRPKKHDDFVLPAIPKRGRNTEHGSQRRSLGPPRKGVPHLLLH